MAFLLQSSSTASHTTKGAGFLPYRIDLPKKHTTIHHDHHHRWMIRSSIKCLSATTSSIHPSEPTKNTDQRRTANYKRSIWDFDFVQSLNSPYKEESYKKETKKLEEEVRLRLDDEAQQGDQLGLLELIDDIGRLGLGYLFEQDIKKALDTIVCMQDMETSLHATALRFRLLRQHGYEVNQDMLTHFKDKAGNFRARYVADAQGMLSLHEASHLAIEGESMLVEAKHFTMTVLKEIIKDNNIGPNLEKQVKHALELPIHWRITRLEARWYMDVYEKKDNSIPALLQLAKLDFNIVQALHQDNLTDLSRWWMNLGVVDQLSFARDSLIPCYLWTLGLNPEPQFSNFRKDLTKTNLLITLVDDVYDVYGTLEELELFTDAVERWDIKAVEKLPQYMKICFFVLFNTVNDMAYFHLKEHGIDSLPFLKQVWVDLCKVYLVEAKWYYSAHKTTLEEYLNTAVISVGCNVILFHSFFSLPHTISKETLACLSQDLSLLRNSSMIVRLADDLGTSTAELERGDTLKSIQSYMYETDASENKAREHIGHMIDETWQKLNGDIFSNNEHLSLSHQFIKTATNLTRMSQCIYQYGDGHGTFDDNNKSRANSLLFQSIPLLMDL